jgi:hypothetical protein
LMAINAAVVTGRWWGLGSSPIGRNMGWNVDGV